MQPSLKVAACLVACSATIIGGSARAAAPNRETSSTIGCENGSVTIAGALWPPDHKYHPFSVSYEGGAPGDVLTASAISTDGAGFEPTDPQTSTVPTDATGTSTAIGLFAEHARPGGERMYALIYSVSGTNLCGGIVLVAPPHVGRPVA